MTRPGMNKTPMSYEEKRRKSIVWPNLYPGESKADYKYRVGNTALRIEQAKPTVKPHKGAAKPASAVGKKKAKKRVMKKMYKPK